MGCRGLLKRGAALSALGACGQKESCWAVFVSPDTRAASVHKEGTAEKRHRPSKEGTAGSWRVLGCHAALGWVERGTVRGVKRGAVRESVGKGVGGAPAMVQLSKPLGPTICVRKCV